MIRNYQGDLVKPYTRYLIVPEDHICYDCPNKLDNCFPNNQKECEMKPKEKSENC